MRTALVEGWCESDKAYPAQCEGFTERGRPRFLSADPGCERSRGMEVQPSGHCHASCCSMRHRKHECRIRHEWSNPQWTARAYPCGLPAAFRSPPVEQCARTSSRFESAKALAEMRASLAIRVLNACLFGNDALPGLRATGADDRAASASAPNLRIRCQRRRPRCHVGQVERWSRRGPCTSVV